MNFDDFVNIVYRENVFDDENTKYIKDEIFPYLIPALEKLVKLVNQEKEKHKYFKILYDCDEKQLLTNLYGEMSDTNIEHIDIFGTDKLKLSSVDLFEIQKEVLKKYVKINPILLLSEYLVEEYKKNIKINENNIY